MSPKDYLESALLTIFVAGAFFGIPTFLIFRRIPTVPRIPTLLAVLGIYTVAIYLKPDSLPLWVLPLALNASLVLAQKGSAPRAIQEFLKPLWQWSTLAILLYCFVSFFLRWDPPGTDGVKWGSLARLIFERNRVPGDTWPITAVTDLKGANLGIPVVIALSHFGRLVPLERLIYFFECASLSLFIFSLASMLTVWFESRVALLAAFFSLVLFTNPQQYLTWGGTPTLVGMLTGFCLVEFARILRKRSPSWVETVIFGLAIAFTAYAHPIGFYISVLVCSPLFIWLSFEDKKTRQSIPYWLALGGVFALFFSPFFLHWGFTVSAHELAETWSWQKRMSPYLFQSQHSPLLSLATQLGAYLWSTAAWICFLLALIAVYFEKQRRRFVPVLLMFLVIALLVLNTRSWFLPLSFLLYPERSATLLVLPAAVPIAWICQQWISRKNKLLHLFSNIVLIVLLVLGGHQFYRRLYPFVSHSDMTMKDKQAISYLAKNVPETECVEIQMESASMWVAPLAFRCTKPFHGLGMNTIDLERNEKRPLRWLMIPSQSKLENPVGKVVFDNGAKIIRKP